MKMKPDLPLRNCLRCGHAWVGRKPVTTHCPKCRSPYWHKPRRKDLPPEAKTTGLLPQCKLCQIHGQLPDCPACTKIRANLGQKPPEPDPPDDAHEMMP